MSRKLFRCVWLYDEQANNHYSETNVDDGSCNMM